MIDERIRVSKHISIGPQPDEDDLQDLAEEGFRTIVNLRKKGELDQPLTPEGEGAEVRDLGMEYLHWPVSLTSLKNEQFDELMAELENHEKPVFLHCRIGQRAAPFGFLLHAIQSGMGPEKVLKLASKRGVEFSVPFLRSFVERYLEMLAEEEMAEAAA